MSSPSQQEVHFEKERSLSLAAYKAILHARDEELTEARDSTGPASSRWRNLEGDVQAARGTCQDIFAALLRLTDGRRIPEWFVLILAFGFAALEAPINKFMLDNILRGNNFDSYALSLFVSLIILLLAHIAGTQARQIRGAYEEKIYWGKIIISVALLGVLAVVVGALTIGRAYYSVAGFSLPSGNIFSEISSRVQKIGPWSAFVTALSDQAAFFLASLNTAGIAGAFVLAFISRDSDSVYQAALDKLERVQRRLDRMAKKYDKRIEKIGKKHHRKLLVLAAAYGAQNAEVIALKRSRNESLSEDDRVDLGKLDTFLQRARGELDQASTSSAMSKADEPGLRATPQVIAIDRK